MKPPGARNFPFFTNGSWNGRRNDGLQTGIVLNYQVEVKEIYVKPNGITETRKDVRQTAIRKKAVSG